MQIGVYLKKIIIIFILFTLFLADIVKFDNSYSMLRSKSLSYWVEVLEPLSEEEEIAFREPERDMSVFD